MKGRSVVKVVGFGLVGLMFLGFVLEAVLQIKAGADVGYQNYRHQPMTYLGALASLGVAALLGLVALYHRLKQMYEKRRDAVAMQKRRVQDA